MKSWTPSDNEDPKPTAYRAEKDTKQGEEDPLSEAFDDVIDQTDEELEDFTKKHLFLSGAFLVGLFALLGILGYFFESDIRELSDWAAQKFGFWGMGLMVLIGDAFISPIPPDLVLVVIAKSSMKEHWYFYVTIIGLISTFAGHLGWLIGRGILESPWFPKTVKSYFASKQKLVHRFGHWAVIIGATTPFPFSVTCWSAGLLKMPWKKFAIASSFRFVRVIIYYWAIASSNFIH